VAWALGMVTLPPQHRKAKVNSASGGAELQTGMLRERKVGSSTFCRMN